ncbi:MAG: hypothetical protein GIKADHBN_02345 [Phycisphaerales bacterium]|nr:hypothetical protein [Phycisphaerales bacterium]
MTSSSLVVPSGNLSTAWAQAFLRVRAAAGAALSCPQLISITDFDESGDPMEVSQIRIALDAAIETINRNQQKRKVQAVADTARTIFPRGSWSPANPRPASELFERYLNKVLPRLKKLSRLNRQGTYFARMIDATGVHGAELEFRRVNQLEEILRWWERDDGSTRRSALQVGIYDPAKDHTGSSRAGFPCLQQVSCGYSDEGFSLTAFYPTEYIFDRGYGNYLGLCHLAGFMAHEMRLKLHRVTVIVALARLGIPKGRVAGLAEALMAVPGVSEGDTQLPAPGSMR